MRFVYTRGHPGVWAVGCGELDVMTVDVDTVFEVAKQGDWV
jgi:hypothetical protein